MFFFSPWIISCAILVICAVVVVMETCGKKKKKKKKKVPLGPRAWPIIGHLHLVGKNLHHDLHNLSKKYGPNIMSLKLGMVKHVVVSSPRGAELFLKTHDLSFATRPSLVSAKCMVFDQSDLSFSKYGSYWRNMRKFCTVQLLGGVKINSLRSTRSQEVGLFVKSLKDRQSSPSGSVVIDLSAEIMTLSANLSCLMVFGKKYSDDEFSEKGFQYVVREAMHLFAAPHLGDYFPLLGVLDPQGLTRRMKKVSKIFDKFLGTIIDEREKLLLELEDGDQNEDQTSHDFVSTMLKVMRSGDIDFEFDRRHVKGVMLDMLLASMDTSATSVEWLLSEVFRQPRVMHKVQQELEQTIGLDRMVEESDLDKLNYLNMVVKENFRLHPPVPLLLQHEAMEDCTVDGYHVPKQTRVIINAWSIGRDSNTWKEDPDKFIPERFMMMMMRSDGSKVAVDVKGQNFELIPFGSGRRGCPGMQLGFIVVRLVVAQLLHCFNWKLPDGMLPEEMDMTEEFGLTLARKKHLMAIPSYRLRL